MERDFALLAGKVGSVRTYRTTDGGDGTDVCDAERERSCEA